MEKLLRNCKRLERGEEKGRKFEASQLETRKGKILGGPNRKKSRRLHSSQGLALLVPTAEMYGHVKATRTGQASNELAIHSPGPSLAAVRHRAEKMRLESASCQRLGSGQARPRRQAELAGSAPQLPVNALCFGVFLLHRNCSECCGCQLGVVESLQMFTDAQPFWFQLSLTAFTNKSSSYHLTYFHHPLFTFFSIF